MIIQLFGQYLQGEIEDLKIDNEDFLLVGLDDKLERYNTLDGNLDWTIQGSFGKPITLDNSSNILIPGYQQIIKVDYNGINYDNVSLYNVDSSAYIESDQTGNIYRSWLEYESMSQNTLKLEKLDINGNVVWNTTGVQATVGSIKYMILTLIRIKMFMF